MTTRPIPSPAITPQAWSDILLVERYRSLTLDLARLHCPERSRDALRTAFERLSKQRWLSKTVLPGGGEAAYALGTRAARLLGRHQRTGFPLTGDGLLQHLGIAMFCGLSGFQRLLPCEFVQRFPGIHRPGLPSANYAADSMDPGLIAWCLVDHATESRRFVQKVDKVIAARLPLPGFEELCARQMFRIVIITATAEKKVRIERAMEERPASVPVSVIYFDYLLQFMLEGG